MLTMMKDMEKKVPMPDFIMQKIEYHLAFFLLINGVFMGYLAIYESTSTWAFFKSIGFYLVFLVFLVAEIFVIKNSFKKYMAQQVNYGDQYGER